MGSEELHFRGVHWKGLGRFTQFAWGEVRGTLGWDGTCVKSLKEGSAWLRSTVTGSAGSCDGVMGGI